MGKKARANKPEDAADGRDVRRAIRRLGLIESNQPLEAWDAQARTQLPEESVQRYYDFKTGTPDENFYDFTYQDYDHARVFHASWSSHALESELVWMISRLRSALNRVESERRVLIELGAGHGAAAAIVSSVLKVPVLTIDPEPAALGLPEQFATRTGGDVTSITASAVDLPGAVDGRIPAAIFGLGVFRYFQTHQHGNDSFAFMKAMDHMFANREPDTQSSAFFQANAPAEMIFSEKGCPDYLAEVLLGARAAGYELASDGASLTYGVVAGGEPQDLILFHLTPAGSLSSGKHPFMEMLEPLPSLQAGLRVEGIQAEAIRAINDPHVETIESVEVEYANGKLRREIFTTGNLLAGVYKATNLGFRSIEISPNSELQRIIEDERAEDEYLKQYQMATVRPIMASPSRW